MKKVLICLAHADDETIGCGGYIKYLTKKGHKVYCVSFTDGVSARLQVKPKQIKDRLLNSYKASKILGFKFIDNFNFPDNQMDQVPLLNVIEKIEQIKKKLNPNIVITHNITDLNVDHRVVAEATLTAFRPTPEQNSLDILSCEIPSATDFRMIKKQSIFVPNFYINIEKFLKHKIQALKFYRKEIKSYPNSRSLKGILNLNKLRGNQVGLKFAEAFEILRKINK
mgnify:CR=1 FL=1|tara:strand:- start:5859 stop:6533 length:675 start_codon:yes stop_codon:yes gene_type:complete